ncbi:MAG: hypothetical protein PHE55_00265 [Methylococcaceae bacterium]|nr:hypothetical protein [Methylococcaceae bacterium]
MQSLLFRPQPKQRKAPPDLAELVLALREGRPVQQEARIRLLFGLEDWMQSPELSLDTALGLKGTRQPRAIRDEALRQMANLIPGSTDAKCQCILGVVEQAQLAEPLGDEPQIMRLARMALASGLRIPGTVRRLRDILDGAK